jgi:nucleoside triphosphate diphosphatase
MENDNFQQLVDLIRELRKPTTGCAWTKQQTMQSLAPMTIEESYELMDAVLQNDAEQIKNELGDLLYHIIFYSEIARENNLFDIQDVANVMLEKHQQRMPAQHEKLSAEEINAHWQQKKLSTEVGILANIPHSLSPTQRATKLQQCAAKVGFDWHSPNDILVKLAEEIQELKEELTLENNSPRIHEELGDILFCAINLSRYLKIHPDTVLTMANQKFINRISFIEKTLAQRGASMQNTPLSELESIWQESKRFEDAS